MIKFSLKHYIGDAVLCVLLTVFIICISIFVMTDKSGTNKQVRILHNGSEIAVYDLSKNRAFEIQGVHIRIKNGKAVIVSSDCPDKICTEMPGVDKDGGSAVCIPNKIVLEPAVSCGTTDATAG